MEVNTKPTITPIALVGIDVGGTFTDFVVLAGGHMRIFKNSTTPADQSRAIVAGLADLGLGRAEIVHGTTTATNALLERRGARTALLTTAGFADVLVIGRQNRPHLYRLSQERPPPLVADGWRLEVPERLDAAGNVLVPLDEAAVTALARRLAQEGAESLAIVFLFSFHNPAHELRAAELVRGVCPDLPLSLSSAILPEYREYERTATTVINAYVAPLVGRYLARLEQALGSRRVRVMQSNGGAIGLAQVVEQAARLVLSGPAGGVVGAFFVAQQAGSGGVPHLITFDMGGTSTDVALCPGTIPYTAESTIADLPLRLPAIDIHTVGAGGGSLARVDAGGVLHVGPQSAGAVPGPVCYGRGGAEPTVTDANLTLNRLDSDHFLGGRGDVSLDAAAARAALARLGEQLGGYTPEQAALGVLRVANATMERALRRVSVERGYDPRDFTLLPFGGAGPLHACDLAEALGIPRILVPPHPGVLSALGLLVADVVHDASQAVLCSLDSLLDHPTPLQDGYASTLRRVQEVLRAEGFSEPAIEAALDLRYKGQSYELTIPLALPITEDAVVGAARDFHAAHARRYGYDMPEELVEVVTLRVRGIGPGARLELPREPLGGADAGPARLSDGPVWFAAEGPVAAVCYDRARLRPGNRFVGPAVVFQYDTTTVVAPGWEVRVDEWHNLWLEREG